MFKTIYRTFAAFFILALSHPAQAGFLFEPYASHAIQGDYEQGNTQGTVSLTNFGARLGFEFRKGFQIGADVQTGRGNIEFDGGGEADIVPLNLGITAGLQGRRGFRVYFTYFLDARNSFDDVTDTIHKGIGYKAGLGYRFNHWFAANLEYQAMSYDEFDSNLGSGSLANESKMSTLMIVASFPLNFGR